jgi:hypothetical protein
MHASTGYGKTLDTTCVLSAEADSEKVTNGLDAGLKASSARKHASVDFFRSLSRRAPPDMRGVSKLQIETLQAAQIAWDQRKPAQRPRDYASIGANFGDSMSALLRPLTLGELLDRAFQLYRSRFGLFLAIAAIAYLPLFVTQTCLLWLPKATSAASLRVITAAGVGFLFALVVQWLGVAAAHAATIIVVSAAYLERPISLQEAYGRVSGMLLRVFFIMIGSVIGILIGTVLFIVPGVILFMMWALVIPVAVLEDAGLSESLSRSRYLTAGHRVRVVAIYLLYFFLVFALEAAILGPLGVMLVIKGGVAAHANATPAISVVSTILAYLIQCVVTPILTICLSLMYYDERVRKEAFDIHLMMSALDKGAAGAAAAGAS